MVHAIMVRRISFNNSSFLEIILTQPYATETDWSNTTSIKQVRYMQHLSDILGDIRCECLNHSFETSRETHLSRLTQT